MVKVSKGLGSHFQDMYSKSATKAEKKHARYIATKNKEVFSWVGDKLWYKVSQKVKAIVGKSDYQAMKKEMKSEVIEAFQNENYDKKKLGKLVDFNIDLAVNLNQFSMKHPKASNQEGKDFIKDFAQQRGLTDEQIKIIQSAFIS